MEKQKERKDINIEDTWDLTLIFKSDEAFYSELDKVTKELNEITKYQDHILDSSSTLLSFLRDSDNDERKLYKLYYYAHLKLDQDTANTTYQEMEGKVANLLQKYSILTSFVMPELMKGDYNKVLEYINKNKELEVYRFNLECIYRYQNHSLNHDEEKIISMLSKSLDTAESTFESLTDADMTFPDIVIGDNHLELTESNYSTYLDSPNIEIRKQAFNNLLGTYGKYKNTLASTFSGNVELLTSMAKIKKFNSSLEASLYPDNINPSVYNNLIDTINNHMDVVYKYFDLKKLALDLDELHLYDIYRTMVNDYEKNYTFDEAKEIVVDALSIMGEDYTNNLKKAFSERWIDKYNNKGKRGGAYSSGFYDTKPYVLLNFEGKYNDVTTLAHELGHSMHTYYSCSNQPYNLSSYNIFVAEVASTVNELLLVRYLLKKSTVKEEKLFLLNKLMELYKATIYRQVMFAEFERDMHKALESGEILTNEYLSNNYVELVKKYFGPGVVIDDNIKNEWMRIPHFYYNFYVYKYAIGLSCATKIVNDIEAGRKDDYLNFLKTGGSMYPADELKIAHVDINDSNLYLEAIKTFESYINEYKEVMKGE